MTRRIDLFVSTDDPIGAVAAIIARVGDFETGPVAGDGSVTLAREGVVATLSEHHLPDGDELRLSGYRYVLTATADVAGHLGDAPETLLLRRLAAHLAGELGVLLVLDLPRPEERRPADPGSHLGAGGARSWGR